MGHLMPLQDFLQDNSFKHGPAHNYPLNLQRNCSNASLRLTCLFLKLLEEQFPISSLQHEMKCRYPYDFSTSIAVHTNHLNRCLKEITGKTTSQLIAERIVTEACLLLKRTDWNICEIGYCLGFEDDAHFTTFFKKYTGISPALYRKQITVSSCND